jgi:hypothetical protein
MFTVHATKKLRDRVKQRIANLVIEPMTAVGIWYATRFSGGRGISVPTIS